MQNGSELAKLDNSAAYLEELQPMVEKLSLTARMSEDGQRVELHQGETPVAQLIRIGIYWKAEGHMEQYFSITKAFEIATGVNMNNGLTFSTMKDVTNAEILAALAGVESLDEIGDIAGVLGGQTRQTDAATALFFLQRVERFSQAEYDTVRQRDCRCAMIIAWIFMHLPASEQRRRALNVLLELPTGINQLNLCWTYLSEDQFQGERDYLADLVRQKGDLHRFSPLLLQALNLSHL